MRMAMIMNDEDALDSSSHARVFIVVLETLETGRDGGVFFWLGFFGAVQEAVGMVMGGICGRGFLPKSEVGERVPEK